VLHQKPCWPKIQYMRWIVAARLLATSLFIVPSLHAQKAAASSPFQMEQSTSKASLRGIHSVGGGVAWASGTNGTVLRTEDSGFVWQSCAMPPGAENLDFRGVWAWDAMTAIVMSSGPGDASRLYKTTDGCVSWKLLATNTDKDGFWDAIAFSDEKDGLLLGDPVNRRIVLLGTRDGGISWTNVMSPGLDIAEAPVGFFAASNSSMVLEDADARDIGDAWIGSGSAKTSAGRWVGPYIFNGDAACGMKEPPRRCAKNAGFHRESTPIAGGSAAAGTFALDIRYDHGGVRKIVAVGGDYKAPANTLGTAAWALGGGPKWVTASKPPHGYRSAVAWDAADEAWVCAGPNGSDYSLDDGKTWQTLDVTDVKNGWNAISLPWFVGPNGRIGKLVSLPH
jgi:hypothetical protein